MASVVEVQEVPKTTTEPKQAGTELDVSALNPDADGDGNISPLEKEVRRAAAPFPFYVLLHPPPSSNLCIGCFMLIVRPTIPYLVACVH